MKVILLALFAATVCLGTLVTSRPPNDSRVAAVSRPDALQPDDPLIPPIQPDLLYSPLPMDTDFSHDTRATFHGHGDQICASGCAVSRHPTDKLTKPHYLRLLAQCAASDLNADNMAYEALLYFGRQTMSMIASFGTPHLSDDKRSTILRELGRQHARVSIRVVDQWGQKRSWVDEVRVPLDRRHVFEMQTSGLPPLVTSGTVKRVGQDHLWTRL